MHELFVAADCSQNITRILFVDFSKVFDVIDHNILLDKFISNDIPEHITVWSVDFLNGLLNLQIIFVHAGMMTLSQLTSHILTGNNFITRQLFKNSY